MTDIEGSTKVEYTDKAMSSSSLQEYRTYPIRFYGLTVIGLLNIASSLCWLSVAPVPDYASAYFGGASLTVINWFSNVFMLTYLVAGPLSSMVYDRWSIKIGVRRHAIEGKHGWLIISIIARGWCLFTSAWFLVTFLFMVCQGFVFWPIRSCHGGTGKMMS